MFGRWALIPSSPGLLDRDDILAPEPTRAILTCAHLACPGQPVFLAHTVSTKEGGIILLVIVRLWSSTAH
jgi:hypothetical protein